MSEIFEITFNINTFENETEMLKYIDDKVSVLTESLLKFKNEVYFCKIMYDNKSI